MNGLVDRTAAEDYIKPIVFTTKKNNEAKALDKVKRIMNLSNKSFEYFSNQLMQGEGTKVKNILHQWSQERGK